jgi:Zn-dependent protease
MERLLEYQEGALKQEGIGMFLGKWLGIPVHLHWSWLAVFSFVAFSNPKIGLVYAIMFLIVLLHEFGHCLAAKYYNLMVRDVTLYPFGGVAMMTLPTKPQQEIVVALAGPAVNILLIPVILTCWQVFPEYEWMIKEVNQINLVLLIFNLLPSFPMDGGRVFRATLALLLHNHSKATIIASRVGQVFCAFYAILGVMSGNLMLIIIAMFIFMAAEKEAQLARMNDSIRLYYQDMTGIKSPPTAHHDVEESAKMLGEIQRRLAAADRNRHEE